MKQVSLIFIRPQASQSYPHLKGTLISLAEAYPDEDLSPVRPLPSSILESNQITIFIHSQKKKKIEYIFLFVFPNINTIFFSSHASSWFDQKVTIFIFQLYSRTNFWRV